VASIPESIARLERPGQQLWIYYIIRSVLLGPGFIVALPFFFFRYRTLRYRFDEEGIHMRVGILFRKEVNVTYSRIQDIHLSAGLIQRWMRLADVQIQTASGSAKPELVIEGFREFEAVRDFLYTRMRGYVGKASTPPLPGETGIATQFSTNSEAEMVKLLNAIRDELRRTRELIESSKAVPPAHPPTADV
jgi:membrane protein YdbS with pleckstrin-like domain